MLAKVITGHGCISVAGYKLSLVTFLELTFWNSYVVVHVDHILITCDRCTFWSHFDYRRCVEFSHARPSESCSLLLADLRGVWVLPSSCVGAVCFLTREDAVFRVVVRGSLSLGRSLSVINLLGPLSCLTYLGTVFSFGSYSGEKWWLLPGRSLRNEI